jgi:subtilisin family serine protease
VTDTGIQYNHDDLAENMWTHPADGSHGFDADENDNDPMDTGGHGTHCAGTIGARVGNGKGLTGVAWNVKLMAVRFLGPNGGTTSDAIRSVNYSRLNGADIISASWGGGCYTQGLYDAIKACGDAGIPFVAAAGNSPRRTTTPLRITPPATRLRTSSPWPPPRRRIFSPLSPATGAPRSISPRQVAGSGHPTSARKT